MTQRLAWPALVCPLLLALSQAGCGGDQVNLGTDPPDAAVPSPDAEPSDSPLQFGDAWSATSGPPGGLVSSFASDGDLIYASVNFTVFRSDDAGLTWVSLPSHVPLGSPILTVAAHGADVAVSTRAAQVALSHDGGTTWIPAGGVPVVTIAHVMYAGSRLLLVADGELLALDAATDTFYPLANPAGAGRLIAANGSVLVLTDTFGTGLWVSPDAGDHFHAASVPPPASDFPSFTAVVASGGAFYLLGFSVADQFWRSYDGETWQGLGQLPTLSNITLAATSDAIYAASQQTIWRSTRTPADWVDDGASFGSQPPFVNLLASQGGELLMASLDQMIFRRLADGTWGRSDDGVVAAAVTAMAASDEALVVSIGFTDPLRTVDGGGTWEAAQGLPAGFQSYALLGEPGLVLAGSLYDGIYRSSDGGASWGYSSAGLGTYNGTAGPQYREIAAFTRMGDSIFAGTGWGLEFIGEGVVMSGGGVYRSDDDGNTWSADNSGFPIINHNNFGEPMYDPCTAVHTFGDTLLAGTVVTGIVRRDGSSWTPRMTGIPLSAQAGLAPQVSGFADDGTTVWVAIGGYLNGEPGGHGLFRSDDGGGSWTRVDGTFFDDLRADDLLWSRGTLVLSTVGPGGFAHGGVYSSTDGGAHWTPVAEWPDMPAGRLVLTDQTLFAGTTGAGVWTIPVR